MASFSHPLPPQPSPFNPRASSRKPTTKTAVTSASVSGGSRPVHEGSSATSASGKFPWWAAPFSPQLGLMQASRPEDLSCPTHVAYAAAGQEGSAKTEKRGQAVMTAEKARLLRREMRATQTWHDAMYHSAIASRLASPDDDPASLL